MAHKSLGLWAVLLSLIGSKSSSIWRDSPKRGAEKHRGYRLAAKHSAAGEVQGRDGVAWGRRDEAQGRDGG